MSNENKTALTAEDITQLHGAQLLADKDGLINEAKKHTEISILYASLQTQEKDKLINANDIAFKDSVKRNQQTIQLLQSTIESQQKELDILRKNAISDAEVIKQFCDAVIENHKVMDAQQKEIDDLEKERDELREGMQKIATYRSESISSQIARSLLTPTKE